MVMFSFITPALYVPYHRTPVTCVVEKSPTRSVKARSRANRSPTKQLPGMPEALPDLPEAFLNSLHRLIRTRAFTVRVAECIDWPHVRYTGRILPLPSSDASVNGVVIAPYHPFHSITLPPGLLQRACKASSSSEELSQRRLCAIFETYGEGDRIVDERLSEKENFENDIRDQMLAWSDYGQSMRTETDLTNLSGPELLHENYLDLLD